MSRIFPLLLLILVLMTPLASFLEATPDKKRERAQGYTYLNKLRQQAGMTPFSRHPELEKAAQGHADYLSLNKQTGHGQVRGRRGFTGGQPPARVRRAGYLHGRVSENVTAGGKSGSEAVDDLMSAIYHRLGFLDFGSDEVGFGLNLRQGVERYVFNMGLAGLSRVCAKPPGEALFRPPGSYAEPCHNKGVRLRLDYVEGLTNRLMQGNPRLVLWPPPGGQDIPPAFFEETPDPLPDYKVSGYPLSVQFNPLSVKQAKLHAFKFYRHQGAPPGDRIDRRKLREIKATRLFTKQRDPNKKFRELEFALFPLQRLDWNQNYVGEAVFTVDGKKETVLWHFRTRDPGLPIYTLRKKGETLPVQPGRPYLIYYPGSRRAPLIKGLRYQSGKGAETNMEFLDGNSVRIVVRGKVCESVDFEFPGGRFALRLAARDNTSGVQPPEQLYGKCPEYAADYRLAGKNEILPVISGKPYQLYFPPTRRKPRLPGFSFAASSKQVRVESGYGLEHTLQVKVTGPACGQVDFRFKDGRAFSLRLAAKDNTRQEHPPRELYAACPEFGADFRIAGRNELLPMRPGREYEIYFPPSRRHPNIGALSYRISDPRVRPKFRYGAPNTLNVKVDGPLCGTVKVTFQDGRAFTVQLAAQDATKPAGTKARKAPGC